MSRETTWAQSSKVAAVPSDPVVDDPNAPGTARAYELHREP